jgi:asparaginyl-tRNA synthetase
MTGANTRGDHPAYAGLDDPSFIPIGEILDGGHTGKGVRVRGWIHRTRSKGKIAFLVVRDATGLIQVTIKKDDLPEAAFEEAAAALMESSLIVEGEAKEDARAPGGYELKATHVQVIHKAEVFPIKEQQSAELLLDQRHLWVRSQEQLRIQRVKDHLLRAMREWFHANGFIEVTPSVITTNAAEGGSQVFDFDYFGQKAYLSQTAQMYLEALIFTHEKVYSLTPSFRAEKSRTTKHLTEYMHLEAEMAWMGRDDNIRVQEELITWSARQVAEHAKGDLEALGRDPKDLLAFETPFERMDYQEAVTYLQAHGFSEFAFGQDFGTPHERALTEGRTGPLVITDFPKKIKAFYMRESPDDAQRVLCNDILAPEGYGEIVGASERETENQRLIERLQAEGAPLENYAWYLDLRRFGSVPHSGFGLGVERLLQWFTRQEHVRDMTPFPRTINRAYP